MELFVFKRSNRIRKQGLEEREETTHEIMDVKQWSREAGMIPPPPPSGSLLLERFCFALNFALLKMKA